MIILKIMSHKKRGIALIACVMLIVFVSIAVSGVTIFIVQRLSDLDARRIYTNTIYLAQAGVHRALYDFRVHDRGAGIGYFTLGTTPIDANNSFTITATAADLLMLNTSAAALGNSNRDVINLEIQNATNSQTITIDRMIVSWSGVPAGRRLREIRIDSLVPPNPDEWTGSVATGVNVDLTNNFTLNTTPTIYPLTRLRFNATMAAATINVQFVMTDGSTTRTFRVFPDLNENNFTVRSTGNMTGSPVSRRIQAEYNSISGRIVNYREF